MTRNSPYDPERAEETRPTPRIGRKPRVGDRVFGYSSQTGVGEGFIRDSHDVIVWFDGDEPIHVGVGLTDFGYNPTEEGFRLLRKAAADFWEDVDSTHDTNFEARNRCLTLSCLLYTSPSPRD